MTEAIRIISDSRTDEVAIATMSAMTTWAETSGSDLDLCYFSPMGTASSVGLGLALARPDTKVMVLDGDGCLLMNLGSLVTIGAEAPGNLIHFVFDNGSYALSGMQPLPGQGKVNLCNFAREAGISNVREVSSTSDLQEQIGEIMNAAGPVFVNLKVDAEAPEHMDRMTTARHRQRTTRTGWHGLRRSLANG